MLKGLQLLLPLAVALAAVPLTEAQLFGTRDFGRPLQRRAGPGIQSSAGELQGNERFLRGNRARSEFVGSDQRDQQGFVGSEQARGTGAIVSSILGLRERADRSSRINRPLTLPGEQQMYLPKIQLDPVSLPEPQRPELGSTLTAELQSSNHFSQQCAFEVSVAGRTAILRGEVTSAAERDLAELVVRIAPGISQVQNELVLKGSPAPLVTPPPAPGAAPPEE